MSEIDLSERHFSVTITQIFLQIHFDQDTSLLKKYGVNWQMKFSTSVFLYPQESTTLCRTYDTYPTILW